MEQKPYESQPETAAKDHRVRWRSIQDFLSIPQERAQHGRKSSCSRHWNRSPLRRDIHQSSWRPRSRAIASRDVHWLDGRAGPASPGLGSGGQFGRRSARGLLRRNQRRSARGQQRHGNGQRPRHSRGHACHGEKASRRSRDDGAARRRKIRQRNVQSFGRTARRGRFRGERARGQTGTGNLARWRSLGAVVRRAASRRTS